MEKQKQMAKELVILSDNKRITQKITNDRTDHESSLVFFIRKKGKILLRLTKTIILLLK